MIYIGLMSGTSCDGIDVAMAKWSNGSKAPQLLATHHLPYNEKEQIALRQLGVFEHIEWAGLAYWDQKIADLSVTAIKDTLAKINLSANDIAAIGSHGHTLQHKAQPNGFSWQIGDPNRIAEHAKITCVADFRRRDIAAGGQGAPLVPAFFQDILSHKNSDHQCLNLGGIANLTVLKRASHPMGFDCGPANGLLDEAAQAHGLGAYDDDGQCAASGQLNKALLNTWLSHPFIKERPPKSTGRETFNLNALMNMAQQQGVSTQINLADLLATLTAYSAQCVSKAVLDWGSGRGDIYTHGGGIHNSFLMDRIRRALPNHDIKTTAAIDLDPDYVEALAFAWLAKQTIERQPSNAPSVTGAAQPCILGATHWVN